MRKESALEARLAEALMFALFPCDLGDGIEVVHDVEQIEIELDCDLDDDAWYSTPYETIEIRFEPAAVAPVFETVDVRELAAIERSPVWDTLPFAPIEPSDLHHTIPYPRI
jgi:hypothetical protein